MTSDEKEVTTETNGQEKNEEKNQEKVGSSQEKNEDNGVDPSELESAIIRQVEYYFGDMNLVRDKFLHEQIKLDDGWIPLEILIRFNRLAKLTTDFEVICNALSKSTSGLLEISENKKKLRRHPDMPLPEMNEERRKELQSRTIYAKGLPKDAMLDDVLKFFAEQGQVENVVMRRYSCPKTKKRLFKGSVFATFKNKEEGQKFIDNKEVKYGESELLVLWQEDYLKKKQEEFAEKKDRKENKKKDKEEKIKKEAEQAKQSLKLPTGTVLQFTQEKDTTKREHIKEALEKLGGEIAYIDYRQGDKEGYARFAKENEAKEVFEKITDGKLTIEETEVTFKLIEGEEEKQYLEKTVDQILKRRQSFKNTGFKNSGKPYKTRSKQYGRKRKQGGHDDAPPNKVKTDS